MIQFFFQGLTKRKDTSFLCFYITIQNFFINSTFLSEWEQTYTFIFPKEKESYSFTFKSLLLLPVFLEGKPKDILSTVIHNSNFGLTS